ncbi:MAG: T9SS type A sorting domain-containing protein [Flavobacteriales bacterium]|nr:T9SS type A sorting domain-containing protein [Flavobacteriales bacterium]
MQFGNTALATHNVQDLNTALSRMSALGAASLTIPGPKMIWQFGELGYDFSINHCPDGTINGDCRTANKPIRWDYYDEPARRRLYEVSSALYNLKLTEPAFSTSDFQIDLGGFGKRIHLNHPTMNVVAVGNFDVSEISMVPGFQNTGTWYDYFTGDSFEVTDLNQAFTYQAGEYHLYTSVPLETPVIDVSVEEIEATTFGAYPVPAENFITIDLYELGITQNTQVKVVSMTGRTMIDEVFTPERNTIQLNITDLAAGVYVVQIPTATGVATRTIVKK